MVKTKIEVERSDTAITVTIKKTADWPVIISDEFNDIEIDLRAARKLAAFLTLHLGVAP